jgi:hypothetical protein
MDTVPPTPTPHAVQRAKKEESRLMHHARLSTFVLFVRFLDSSCMMWTRWYKG